MIKISNSHLSLSLRSIGAKMMSLKLKHGKKPVELLYLPSNIPKIPKFTNSPAVFSENAAWGGDICLPSVAKCEIKFGNYMLKANDHGDFWTTEFKIKKQTKTTAVLVGSTKYFRLKITFFLQGGTLKRSYSITNLTNHKLPFIFADHLLFPIHKTNLEDNFVNGFLPLPKKMRVEWSYKNKLGIKGDIISWPIRRQRPFADKLFSPLKKNNGFYSAGYRIYNSYNNYNDNILITLFSKELSFLGYWHTEGGWNSQYNLGLELTNSDMDNLEEAVKNNKVWWIKPGKSKKWSIRMKVNKNETNQLTKQLIS